MIVTCHGCGRKYLVRPDRVGEDLLCRHCNTPVPTTLHRDGQDDGRGGPPRTERIHCLVGGAGPVLLDTRRRYLFGRDEEADIRVRDHRASREHAALEWDGEAFSLRDLGSANGTFVDGTPVQTRRLEDGHRIEVAGTPFLYRVVESMEALRDSVRAWRQRSQKEVTTEIKNVFATARAGEFNGSLASFRVPEIVQFLQIGGRSGRLTVTTASEDPYVLDFRKGRVIAAYAGTTTGEAAAYATLALRAGDFTFRSGRPQEEPNLAVPTEHLLLEAARREDEDGAREG